MALAAHLVSGSALGGLQARLDNTANSAASATLLYTHSYGTNSCTSVPAGAVTNSIQAVACPGSPYPASSGAFRSDAITANGNVPAGAVTESVTISSCGIVQAANTADSSNPMLPRYGTTFGTSGPYPGSTAITLDGANPGGYTSAAASETEQGSSLFGASFGVGVWFKASGTSGGPLVSFGTSPARDTTEQFDRTLYLTATGKVSFIYRTNGATVTSTSTYSTGWHFAYARITTSVLGSSTTLYVDGANVGSAGGLFSGLDSLTGYWHLGWAPAANGVPTQYFAGSLADLVVFDDGSAPTSGSTAPGTQAAMDTFASSANSVSGYWRLDDSGVATLASGFTLPVLGTNAPCSYVDVKWGFTNPTSCAVAPASTTSACTVATTKLSAAVGSYTVGTVAAGGTQTGTITLAQDSTWTTTLSAFGSGLIVYAPITMTFKATAAANWYSTFTWSAAGSGFVL
jgi:hypothetical protein